jgi:hypothetical protein
VSVYVDLMRTASELGGHAAGYVIGRERREDLEFAGFELLRKAALRAGFIRQAVSQGYLYA